MKKSLKTLLIFCLVAATTAQSPAGPSTTPPSTVVTETTTTQADPTSITPSTTIPTATTTQDPLSTTTPASTDTTATTTQAGPTSTASSATITTVDGTTSTASPATNTTPANSTQAGTISTAPPTTTTTPATTTRGPCASSPCIGGSTCEDRFGGLFACICRPGLFYDEIHGCVRAKVFPGHLTLDGTFTDNMADTTSEEFKNTARGIEENLRETLGDLDGYLNSTVLKLSPGSIVAEVQNFFDLSSSATTELVDELISESVGEFERVSLCNAGGACDKSTTRCDDQLVDGTATCTCLDGYIMSQFTEDSCIACPSGKKAVDGECENCPFGFAGFNCDDPNLLIVVVVSAVLGSLLIIFMVSLIVVSCRNQKGSSLPEVDFSSSYGNKDLHKPTGVPRIPRANPESNWRSNNLEMTNSDSNQSLVTRDRPESKGRYHEYEEAPSYRTQVPPAYSGYSASRGMDNGGVQNPYFRQDDDRMHRY